MGFHACEVETSVALSTIPERVDLSKAVKNEKPVYPDEFLSWDIDPGPRASYNWDFDFSRSATVSMGDPFAASAEFGEAIVEATVRQAIKALEAMGRQLASPK